MKLIRAAADTDVDDRACGAAILRAVVVGLDAELVDGVGRRRNRLVRKALIRRAVGVVVKTIEKEVVELAALAVDVERGITTGVSRVLEDVAANAGDEGGEVCIRAAVKRRFSTSRVPIT